MEPQCLYKHGVSGWQEEEKKQDVGLVSLIEH